MKDRYLSVVDVYILLRRADGHILLMERANTGYADGQLCPPSGHLEDGESVIAGAIREASEEVGVFIAAQDLRCAHVVHYRSPEQQGRIGFFFVTDTWDGEPWNREPHKCARLLWTDPANPPATTVAYTAGALHQIANGNSFSLDGWPESDLLHR
ncbi:NUDIX domain-containing protein [Nocardia uniformis]|uniref:NUDIX domain-containing protein n=1 Tax=Nocardia uniformis TaxID=53432 RepID=A0A849CBM0_9NOCA|nr:NUDIX domain-containing protein [Nocardia uniformis]NNH73675.1 NUDIX domain-containing protein [Nocardia uniformis]